MNSNKMSEEEREARSRARQLLGKEITRGTLVERARVCGKPNCHCVRGERHVSLYLTRSREGRFEQFHIPRGREEEVRAAVENWHRVKDLLEEVSSSCLERLKGKD